MFSVVIPARNRQRQLIRAVVSAAAQSDPPAEIIVVDDGSTDGTPAMLGHLERLVAKLSAGRTAFLAVRRDVPEGACAARNAGIAAARGRYVAFLDSDDMWHPEKLRAQARAMEAAGAERWVLSFTGRLRVRSDGSLVDRQATRLHDAGWGSLRSNSIGPLSSVAVTREALEAVGGFDRRLPASQDWDLFLRLAPLTHPVPVAEPLLWYYDGAGERISNSSPHRIRGHLAIRRLHFRDVDPQHQPELYRALATELDAVAKSRAGRIARLRPHTHKGAIARTYSLLADNLVTSLRPTYRQIHRALKHRAQAGDNARYLADYARLVDRAEAEAVEILGPAG